MLVKFTLTHLWNCERFEPRSHFKSRLSLIIRVNVVLNRAVVVDRDWRFDNLCGSHLQSQSQRLCDSENDYCTGCQNVSHCQQEQSYSGLHSLGRSNSTCFWHLWKLTHKLRKSVHGLSTIWLTQGFIARNWVIRNLPLVDNFTQMSVFCQPKPCIGAFVHITNWTPKFVYTLLQLQPKLHWVLLWL